MQEDSPKTLLPSPPVIEGEIQHGYELLTGFENVLCANPTESYNKHNKNSRLKNTNLMSQFLAEHEQDSADSSTEAMITVGQDGYGLVPTTDGLGNGQGKFSGSHVRENGHITVRKQTKPPAAEVSAPKAPGHIHTWEDDYYSQYNEISRKHDIRNSQDSGKRRPFFRQNAQEMNDFGCEVAPSTQSESFESSYLW